MGVQIHPQGKQQPGCLAKSVPPCRCFSVRQNSSALAMELCLALAHQCDHLAWCWFSWPRHKLSLIQKSKLFLSIYLIVNCSCLSQIDNKIVPMSHKLWLDDSVWHVAHSSSYRLKVPLVLYVNMWVVTVFCMFQQWTPVNCLCFVANLN